MASSEAKETWQVSISLALPFAHSHHTPGSEFARIMLGFLRLASHAMPPHPRISATLLPSQSRTIASATPAGALVTPFADAPTTPPNLLTSVEPGSPLQLNPCPLLANPITSGGALHKE